MKTIVSYSYIVSLFLLAFFTLVPALMYGIVNIGVVALAIITGWVGFCYYLWLFKKGGRLYKVSHLLLVLFMVAEIIFSAVMLLACSGDIDTSTEHTAVVLGCRVIGDKPSLMLENRLKSILPVLIENPEMPVVTTGGGSGDITEGQASKDWLVAHGVEPSRIYVENQSTDTHENFLFARDIIFDENLPKKLVIATDGFHQLRGRIFASFVGLSPVASAVGVTPWGLLPSYWLREQAGVVEAVLITVFNFNI